MSSQLSEFQINVFDFLGNYWILVPKIQPEDKHMDQVFFLHVPRQSKHYIHQSKFFRIRCSYLQDEETVFYDNLDTLIDQGEINAVIGFDHLQDLARLALYNPPAKVSVDEDTRIIARLDNAFSVFVNGTRQPADVYGSGKARFPILLKSSTCVSTLLWFRLLNLIIFRTEFR